MRKTIMVLVGDIVHDLRTPIATIRTANNILQKLIPSLIEIVHRARKHRLSKLEPLSDKEYNYLSRNSATTAIKNSVIMMDNFINATLLELQRAQISDPGKLSGKDLSRCSSRRVLENAIDSFPFPEDVQVHQYTSYKKRLEQV